MSRIDERLIHGQVATAWISYVDSNTIYVIDDATARNALLSRMIVSVAPKGVAVKVLSVKDAVQLIAQDPASANEKVLLIAKTPGVFEDLLKAGIELKSINLGGMGGAKNRTSFIENVSASVEEVECMSRMLRMGVSIYYQMTPYSKKMDVAKILKRT